MKYLIHGKLYNPVKVGDPGDWYEGSDVSETCGDCGAKFGEPHKPYCDTERCPKCGGQMFGGCDNCCGGVGYEIISKGTPRKEIKRLIKLQLEEIKNEEGGL